MHIFVFGNLNVGKTTFCNKLLDILPTYVYLSLDVYRQKLSDGTLIGENVARQAFLQDIINTQNAIVDFTGCGEVAMHLKEMLMYKSGILIAVERPLNEAIEDLEDTKYQKIPYPNEYKEAQSLPETMHALSTQTQLSTLENAWCHHIWQSYCYQFKQGFDDFWKAFPLRQHQWIAKLNKLVQSDSSVSESLLYGSTGANSVTPDSDVDLFLVSTESPRDWRNKLSEKFKEDLLHTDLLGHKVTLRTTDGVLIEVSVGGHVDDNALYYRESVVYNVNFTLLKQTPITFNSVLHAIEEHEPPAKKATAIAAECYFLLCSLPTLIKHSDSYKYAFHCSIMRHYAIQLEHLIHGVIAHNYLPKQAAKVLTSFPWDAFEASGTEISKSQYFKLYNYLRKLFLNLEKHQFIEANHYFSKQASKMHQIN